MKTHTTEFKNEIKEFGREIDSIITYTLNNEVIELSDDELNSVTPHYKSAILKSIMKQLDIDTNIEIPAGTIVNYKFGVKVRDDEVDDEIENDYRKNYDYINYGNYIVKEVEKQEDTDSYSIKCYDKLLLTMVDYTSLDITYPITIDNYIKAICDHFGYTFKNYQTIYPNYDKEIPKELYLTYNDETEKWESLNYTFRDVLDELAQVTAGTICINENDDELEIRYITETNDTINEEYLKDINVNFNEKYGPINTIVLSRSAGSDKIYKSYPADLSDDEKNAIEIADNQIMNSDDRDEFLPDILDQLKGLEYYLNDFSSTGIGYYNMCDKYNISITKYDGEEDEEGTTVIYPCVMLNDEFSVTQGDVSENIHTDMPEETDTEYKYTDTTDKRRNRTTLIVDKQNQQIIATIETIQDDLEKNYITTSQVDEMIINSTDGIKNTLIKAGGNNLIRNSALLFKDSEGKYEFWQGDIERGNSDAYNVISETGTVILTKISGASQPINIVPDTYTLSFKYKRISLTSDLNFQVNKKSLVLEDEDKGEVIYTFKNDNNNITIDFASTKDNGYIIYDLMLNKGDTALDYSQNANETTTDTVKIGKGIAVTSDSDTLTRIDSDGFRVLNKNNESDILLRATDTGTDTKTLEVREWAEISGLRFQKTNDQTWVTGII